MLELCTIHLREGGSENTLFSRGTAQQGNSDNKEIGTPQSYKLENEQLMVSESYQVFTIKQTMELQATATSRTQQSSCHPNKQLQKTKTRGPKTS